MKLEINLADARRRDAVVVMEPRRRWRHTIYVDAGRRPVKAIRVVRGTLGTDLRTLAAGRSLEDVSQLLAEGDPEVDRELFGKQIERLQRIYLTDEGEPARGVRIRECLYDAAGQLREERRPVEREANVAGERPLRWTGRFLPKKEVYKKFVFVQKYQLYHVNGLTYEFLHDIAHELEQRDAFLHLGAGDRGTEPLVLHRGGLPYRGFLEGRTDGERYLLILHLSNLELKSPEA